MKQRTQQNNYQWYGVDHTQKPCQGIIAGQKLQDVQAQLEENGIELQKIYRLKPLSLTHKLILNHTETITFILEQLRSLLDAKISLPDALKIIQEEQKSPYFKKLLKHLCTHLEQGFSFSESLRQRPQDFDPFLITLVASSEATGELTQVLIWIIEDRQQNSKWRSQCAQSLFYPALILIFTMMILILLSQVLVPEFEKLFAQANQPLPNLTMSIIQALRYLGDAWKMLLISVLLNLWFFCEIYKRAEWIQTMCEKIQAHLPIVARFRQNLLTLNFSRHLSLLIRSGLTLPEAFNWIAQSMTSRLHKRALQTIGRQLQDGISFRTTIQGSSLFPTWVEQILITGEEAQILDQSLKQLRTLYQHKLETQMNALQQWVEPLTLLILGGGIATLLVAMYTPLFNLGTLL